MTIQHTDNFDVATDVALTAYDAPGDVTWAAARNGGALLVHAISDAVRTTIEDANDRWCRAVGAAIPTGNQEITAVVVASATSQAQGQVGVRFSGTVGEGYLLFRASTTSVELYRLDAGAFVGPLATITGSFPNATPMTVRFRALGTGASVALDWTYNGVNGSFTDTAANRKTSGTPAIGVYNPGAGLGAATVDSVVIDDTITGAAFRSAFSPNRNSGAEQMFRNTAGQVVTAQLVNRTDGTDVTTGTTTVLVKRQGAAQAAGTGTVTHVGGGTWQYEPSAADSDADHITFTFQNPAAVSAVVQVFTQDKFVSDVLNASARTMALGVVGAGGTVTSMPLSSIQHAGGTTVAENVLAGRRVFVRGDAAGTGNDLAGARITANTAGATPVLTLDPNDNLPVAAISGDAVAII